MARLARAATISTAKPTNARSPKSLVWDIPTRLFHWLLVLSLAGSWITAEAGFEWTETHFFLGYVAIGLVVFRIIWGFVGTAHARFGEFLTGPKKILAYTKLLFSREPSTSVGHNPIGGWSAVVLISLVAIQATTGMFLTDDIFYVGPYNAVVSSATAKTMASIHHLNFTALQIFVGIHVLAILWYRWGKGSDLITPMITGKKALADQGKAIVSSKLGLAVLVAGVVAAAVTALVQLAPPPPIPDFY